MDEFKSANLIIIEDGEYVFFKEKEDLIKFLLGDDYYRLSNSERKKRLELKVLANSLGHKYEEDNLIDDEIIFIYWLLINSNLILFERKDYNFFTKNLDKSKITSNYIMVNKFAKHLMESYSNNR